MGVDPIIGQPPGPPKQYTPVLSLAMATEPMGVCNLGLLSLGIDSFLSKSPKYASQELDSAN